MTTAYDDVVARFTYKPGVRFTCEPRNGMVKVDLIAVTRDSRNPEAEPRDFAVSRLLSPDLPPGLVREELVQLCTWWEQHELMEWARWDGELINDPHAEGKLRP